MRLTAAEKTVTITLNGVDICRVATDQPPNFGLLSEDERTVDVREIVLSGAWPEQLPDDLMAESD